MEIKKRKKTYHAVIFNFSYKFPKNLKKKVEKEKSDMLKKNKTNENL